MFSSWLLNSTSGRSDISFQMPCDTRNLVSLLKVTKCSLWVDKELPEHSYCTILCSLPLPGKVWPLKLLCNNHRNMEPTPSQELWGTHRKSSAMVVPAPRSTIKSTIPVRNAPFQSITLPGQWYTTFLTYLWITTAVIFHPTQRTTSNNTGPKAKFRAESLPFPLKDVLRTSTGSRQLQLPIPIPLPRTRPTTPHLAPSPPPWGSPAAQRLTRHKWQRSGVPSFAVRWSPPAFNHEQIICAEDAGSREHGFLRCTNLAPLHSAAFSQLYALANSASDCSSRIFPHKFCHSICILKSTTCTK